MTRSCARTRSRAEFEEEPRVTAQSDHCNSNTRPTKRARKSMTLPESSHTGLEIEHSQTKLQRSPRVKDATSRQLLNLNQDNWSDCQEMDAQHSTNESYAKARRLGSILRARFCLLAMSPELHQGWKRRKESSTMRRQGTEN